MGTQAAHSNAEKAQLLEPYFACCFNISHTTLNDDDFYSIQYSENLPESLLCNEDHICDILFSWMRQNPVVPTIFGMLKSTAVNIAPSVLNLSLQLDRESLESKVVPIPKVLAPK